MQLCFFLLLFSFFFLYFNYYYLIQIITLYSAVIISVYKTTPGTARRKHWRQGHGHERQGDKVSGIQTGSNVCHTVTSLHGGRMSQTPVDIQRLQDAICLEWSTSLQIHSLFPRLSPRSHGTWERVTFSSNRNCRVASR